MTWIKRQLHDTINQDFFKGKAILLVGARQVGKTTLFNQILEKHDEPILRLNCDEPEVRDLLTNVNTNELRSIIGNNRIVVVDEAQRVKNIGISLKLIFDGFPNVQLLITGSSALQLQDTINEPLTGRKWEYHLFPISTSEILNNAGIIAAKQSLERRLVYGSYPDVINNTEDSRKILTNLADSYLYKDILSLDYVRKPALLEKLLVALALQVGSEVSYNELSQTVGCDTKTIEKYIDLLEKCYIIFRLQAYSRNLRNELKKSKKIYFVDNGIRNAIIQNYSPLSLRNDIGSLWENFIISERMKANSYNGIYANSYFWRNSQQQEIDYIEECDGKIKAFEIKWNPRKANVKIPISFQAAYNVESFVVITPDNYLQYL